MRFLLPIFFLLCLSAGATQTNITSLPYTITSQSDDTFNVVGSLTATGDGITITDCSNILVRGQGGNDTVTYNTGDTKTQRGIRLAGLDNLGITIESLTIIQYSAAGDSGYGIQVGGGRDIVIKDCNVHPKGRDCNGIYFAGGLECQVIGGNWTSYVTRFQSRTQKSASAIWYNYAYATYQDSVRDFDIRVRHVTIDSCPHMGIAVSGIMQIDSNTLTGDGRNDDYSFPSGGLGYGFANNFMIYANRIKSGSTITYNTIRSGSNYGGCRGIQLSGADQDDWPNTSDAHCSYNDIDVHAGFEDYYGEGYSTIGIKMEPNNYRIKVHHNTIKVTADSSAATLHTTRSAYGIYVETELLSTCAPQCDSAIQIYNNHITAYADSNNYIDAVENGKVHALIIVSDHPALYNYTYDNYFASNMIPVVLSASGPESNDASSNYWSIRDTMAVFVPRFKRDAQTDTLGVYAVHSSTDKVCTANVILDPIYVGDTDIVPTLFQGISSVWQKVTLNIKVEGQSNIGLPNASVFATNIEGDTVFRDTTNANGIASDTVDYGYDYWSGATHTDSNFNDFIITANWHGITAVDTYTVAWNAKNDTVVVPLNQTYKSTADSIVIGIKSYKIDSSSSNNFDPIGHPRHQLQPLSTAGDIIAYTSGWPGNTGNDNAVYKSFNLDTSGVAPFHQKQSFTGNNATHDHTSLYQDTLYVMHMNNATEAKIYAFNGASLGASLFNYDFWTDGTGWQGVDSLYIMGTIHLPGSDSMVGVSRGTDYVEGFFWISTDGGRNWNAVDQITNLEMYRGGLINYNNSAAIIADSNDKCIEWWNFNRATSSWEKEGRAMNRTSGTYRSFAGNYARDTVEFMTFCMDDAGAAQDDSILWAWKYRGQSAYTEGKFFTSSVDADALNPYQALVSNDSAERVTLFYTKYHTAAADSVSIYMRYWLWGSSAWSPEYQVSSVDHKRAWKTVSCQRVPTTHGDVSYVMYPYDSGSYHYGALARVIFDTLTATQQQQEQSTTHRKLKGISIKGGKL